MTPEKFLECLICGKIENLTGSLKETVKFVFVKKFADGEERPCQESDFLEFKKYNENNIKFLKQILEYLFENNCLVHKNDHDQNINFDDELVALVLIVCGENVKLEPWNTKTSLENCAIILSVLLKFLDCESTFNLVSKGNKKSLFKTVFHILQPKLLKTTWKLFPASVVCYRWILEMIQQPEMSSYIHLVLPTALLLVDDFVNENRITGVHCLHHIIENITIAELQFQNHGDVIYNALKPLLRIRDSNVISSVIPCLTNLTIKLEKDFGKGNPTKWSKFDDIFEIYLEHMDLEHLIDLKSCYMDNLDYLLSASGVRVIRWSKRLLKIFKEYLQLQGNFMNEKLTYSCLKGLEKYVDFTKPVLHLNGKNIIFILLIVVYNIKSNPDVSVKLEIKMLIRRVVNLIKDSVTESYIKMTNEKLQNTYGIDFDLIENYNYLCSI